MNRYERLRSGVLGERALEGGEGLTVLRAEGMRRWMETTPSSLPPPTDKLPTETSAPCASTQGHEEMACLLANMLTANPGDGGLRER